MQASKKLQDHVREIVTSLKLLYHISKCDVRPFTPAATSSLLAIDLYEELPDGKKEVHHFIAKAKLEEDEGKSELFALDNQYFNECTVYNKVIPLFLKMIPCQDSVTRILPECLHSSYSKVDPIVIIENLDKKGFKLGSYEAMDYNHCTLSFKALAEFHSYSIAMKIKHPNIFKEQILQHVKETRLSKNSVSLQLIKKFTTVYGTSCINSLKVLYPEYGITYAEELQKMQKLISESAGEFFHSLVKAEEPFSVLCHGDFNRNNILFRYDDDGKPCEVKLIDFQTVRYASPAIDMSLLLFLNTTTDFRAKHEDELLNIYHQTLMDTTSNFLGCTTEELLPEMALDKFKADYARHAMYGFLISSYFTRVLFATEEESERIRATTLGERCTEEDLESLIPIGGKFIEKRICDMLRDVLVKGYFK